jgi:hypothetical protein
LALKRFCYESLVIRVMCRGERIRTSDPLIPNQVLYQAEPRPEHISHKTYTTVLDRIYNDDAPPKAVFRDAV